MTVKKAISILEEYSKHLDMFSKGWIEKSESFNNQDMKEISKMMGDIMDRDSRIIKMVIGELKTSKDSPKKSKDILTHEMKKEIPKIIKKDIIEHKSSSLPKNLKIRASAKNKISK